jgi:radical SAM protein with 4Fe4S-binding SPASM domain
MGLDINIARIADFIDEHISLVALLENGMPPFSSIEFSNNGLCNRRCIFCPRVDPGLFPNKNIHLSFELFKKAMQEIAAIDYCGRISFSGFCEPLLTEDLERYIAEGKRACPKITVEISSNGDVLTKERLKRLFEAGLDNIRLSLYGGPQQDEKFIKMKQELNLDNKQFILRRRYLSPEESYGLTISNRAGSITLINDKIKVEPLKEPLKQPCYYPFYKMMVDYDGKVMICSNDWQKKLIVGNLSEQSVFAVWNSREFNNARKNLVQSNREFVPCNLCDVNGMYNGQKHYEAWVKHYKNNP